VCMMDRREAEDDALGIQYVLFKTTAHSIMTLAHNF